MKKIIVASGLLFTLVHGSQACSDDDTANPGTDSSVDSSSDASDAGKDIIDTLPPTIIATKPIVTTTSEMGDKTTFTVALTTKPSADVTLTLSVSKPEEASIDKATLTFTAANFNTAQTVTVTGKDDDVVDGDVAYAITFGAATSTDSGYAGKKPADIALTNKDNDSAGLIVSAAAPSTSTTEKGGKVTFNVKLKAKPTADVTVPVATSNDKEGTVDKASLTFTSANYNVDQTITVTGIDDKLADGDVKYSVNLGKSTSADAAFKDLEGKVELSNTDDDSIKQVVGFWGGYCALFVDGRGKCWGRGDLGVLGEGLPNASNRGDAANEMGDNMPFLNLGAGRTIKSFATGNRAEQFMCAILDNDSVKCWGRNDNGQLGLGDTNSRGDQPNEMGDNLPAVNLGAGRTAKKVAIGYQHSCAILDNDSLKCWGWNGFGQLGLNDTNSRGNEANEMGDNLPVLNLGAGRTVKDVALGNEMSCALLDNNTVKCWGYNQDGRLGMGDTFQRGHAANSMGDNLPVVFLGVGRTVKVLQVGLAYACVILDNDMVKCWGAAGSYLGLGDNSPRGASATQMGDNLPALNFGAGRTAKTLKVGHSENCVILDNGDTKCWGQNQEGQLGRGNTTDVGNGANQMGDNLAKLELGAGRTVSQIFPSTYSICALLDNNALKCWGYNGWGQLGTGNTTRLGALPNQMGDNLPAVKLVGP